MENTEVEILLVEDNALEAERILQILKKNDLGNNLIHLKSGREANDFIFCTGEFGKRNIHDQPEVIVYNIKKLKYNDIEFLNRINTDQRTKKIPLIVLSSLEHEALIEQ